MKRHYSKEDVQTHGTGYNRAGTGYGNPAVNVKVYKSIHSEPLPLDLGSSYPASHPELVTHHKTHPGFTLEWIEKNVSDETLDAFFWQACADGIEQCIDDAQEIFGAKRYGSPLDVYQEGRSGGWLVIGNLAPVEEWDAIDLGKWRKWEKHCRATADDIAYQVLSSVYANLFEWRMDVAHAMGYRSA